MTVSAPEIRYERKLDVAGWDRPRLENLVRLHPAQWRELFPERAVHSLYWDTAAFDSFFEHQSGVEKRLKTRLRWYGADLRAARGAALERKIKDGNIGIKERFEVGDLSPFLSRPRAAWTAVWRQPGVPDRVRAEMLMRLPAVWTSYRRQYWLSRDQKFRLTLDHGITAGVWGQPPFKGLRMNFPSPILEIKYAVSADTDAAGLLQSFPFRPAKSSKYVTAAARLLELDRA